MRIKPILFNTEMVQDILDGRKTQTRRAVKLKYANTQLEMRTDKYGTRLVEAEIMTDAHRVKNSDGTTTIKLRAVEDRLPPYKRGDILWVRETWMRISDWTCVDPEVGLPDGYLYRAGWKDDTNQAKWRPSTHMPKEAARIFLRVTDVRVERLQEITDIYALAEGVPDDGDYPLDSSVYCPVCKGDGLTGTIHPVTLGYMETDCPNCDTPRKRFANLWDSIIKPADRDKYGWHANPWVWAIKFERCEKPEGFPT